MSGQTLVEQGNPIRATEVDGSGNPASGGGRKMCQGCLTGTAGTVVEMGEC